MKRFQMMFARYMKPIGEDGGAGGAAVEDRGDDFVPAADPADDAGTKVADAAGTKVEPSAEDVAKLGLGAAKKDDPAVEQTEEEKAAEEAKGGKKDTRIPLSRHTEILARERAQREALEVELANTKKGQQIAASNEEITKLEGKVSELDEKYAKHMAEGETEKAGAVMKEIRALDRTIIEQRAEFRAQASMATAVETMRYDTTVERLELAYPVLNPHHETFDKGLVAEVLDLSSAYELKGYSGSAALQKAVSILIKPETAKQEAATTVTPRVDEAEATRAAREKEARKRAVDTANATPPALAKAGANSDEAGGQLDAKVAIKMPFDKFKALSEEDLSRMRGDTV